MADGRYTEEEIKQIINKTDWGLYHEEVNWALQKPECDCEFCPAYDNWKEWGRDIFTRGKNVERYEREVAEEDARRTSLRASREFDRRERAKERGLLSFV